MFSVIAPVRAAIHTALAAQNIAIYSFVATMPPNGTYAEFGDFSETYTRGRGCISTQLTYTVNCFQKQVGRVGSTVGADTLAQSIIGILNDNLVSLSGTWKATLHQVQSSRSLPLELSADGVIFGREIVFKILASKQV